MPAIADHDAYIAAAPEAFRRLLTRLRARLAAARPEAEEVIQYDMPGFRIGKSIIAGYAAFSKQWPPSPPMPRSGRGSPRDAG